MVNHLPQSAETRPSSLAPLGLLIGPFLGFFGPLAVFAAADRIVRYPGEGSTVLAFALPFLLAGALTAAPATRRWGWWLLAGVAVGEACLVGLFLMIVSGLS